MKNLFRILLFAVSMWATLVPGTGAQNFSTLIPETKETQSQVSPVSTTPEDEELSQNEIEQILVDEGIPMSTTAVNFDAEALSKYTLGVADVIEVKVLRHPEVTGNYEINQEGNIQFEFVGDIQLLGKTKNEAQQILSEALSEYVISPDVTVRIVGYNSKVVYVIGEVGRPGKIFMRGDTITIHEALVQAGLPTLSAKATKSTLITPADNGKPNIEKVNVHKLLYEGDLRENLVMHPGDTLYIPPTAMAKVMRTITPITAPISNAAGAGSAVYGF